MSAESLEVAEIIKEQKLTIAAFSFSVFTLTTEIGMKLIDDYEMETNQPMVTGFYKKPHIVDGIQIDEDYILKLRPSFDYVISNPESRIYFLKNLIGTSILTIGDAMKKKKLLDFKPGYPNEFQFFRHIRNGVAHGNKFNFENPANVKKATFKHFTIEAALHGTNVLMTANEPYFIDTGDILDLFDLIENQLRNLT